MPETALRQPLNVDPVQPLDTTHPLLRGVQGFWLPLPHLSGGARLYDLSGRGRHGDILSDAGWRHDSRRGEYVYFEGAQSSENRVTIPNAQSVSPDGLTIMVVCRFRQIPDNQRQWIAQKYVGDPSPDEFWLEYRTDKIGSLRFVVNNGDFRSVRSTIDLTVGKWYTIIGSSENDGTTDLQLYVNGVRPNILKAANSPNTPVTNTAPLEL